jgi:hypothetical protein
MTEKDKELTLTNNSNCWCIYYFALNIPSKILDIKKCDYCKNIGKKDIPPYINYVSNLPENSLIGKTVKVYTHHNNLVYDCDKGEIDRVLLTIIKDLIYYEIEKVDNKDDEVILYKNKLDDNVIYLKDYYDTKKKQKVYTKLIFLW